MNRSRARCAPVGRRPSRVPLRRATFSAGRVATSYAELVELDKASNARWVKPVLHSRQLKPDSLDLEILELVARMGYLLSSQIHRRFNPTRSATTTQRRLKRLSEAGMVERFQFYRSDGGGVPMCYVVAPVGLQTLVGEGRLSAEDQRDLARLSGSAGAREQRLRFARRAVHAAGWALSLEQSLGRGRLAIRGGALAALSPPLRPGPDGHRACGPSDLRLPGGRAPHDFLRSEGGRRVEVQHFETVRPEVIVEIPANSNQDDAARRPHTLDVLLEFDDRLAGGDSRCVAKLERYDHLLAGWSALTKRYAGVRAATMLVVFVCRDRHRARACARAADALLTACQAYAGEYPVDWEYPGGSGSRSPPSATCTRACCLRGAPSGFRPRCGRRSPDSQARARPRSSVGPSFDGVGIGTQFPGSSCS